MPCPRLLQLVLSLGANRPKDIRFVVSAVWIKIAVLDVNLVFWLEVIVNNEDCHPPLPLPFAQLCECSLAPATGIESAKGLQTPACDGDFLTHESSATPDSW